MPAVRASQPREAWSRKSRSSTWGPPSPWGRRPAPRGGRSPGGAGPPGRGRLGGAGGAIDGAGGATRRRCRGARPSAGGMRRGRGWDMSRHPPSHRESVGRAMPRSAMGRRPGATLRPISTRRVWRHGKRGAEDGAMGGGRGPGARGRGAHGCRRRRASGVAGMGRRLSHRLDRKGQAFCGRTQAPASPSQPKIILVEDPVSAGSGERHGPEKWRLGESRYFRHRASGGPVWPPGRTPGDLGGDRARKIVPSPGRRTNWFPSAPARSTFPASLRELGTFSGTRGGS